MVKIYDFSGKHELSKSMQEKEKNSYRKQWSLVMEEGTAKETLDHVSSMSSLNASIIEKI